MEDIKTVALLPCPFCGGEAEFDCDDSDYHWIACKSCSAATDTDRTYCDEDCRVRLAAQWNRRAELQKDAEPIYCTPTEHEGRVVYEHTAEPIPNADCFVLYPQPKAATVPQGWVANVSVIDGAFVQPSRHVPDGTYSLVVKYAAPSLPAQSTKFSLNDPVRKVKGSQWHGYIVGTYSTKLTPEGYAVESATEKGSVQIYPASALEPWEPAQSEGEQK